ncbi:SLC13 family permease [Cellulosilyticum lentocellum]|uniref:Citrate transporter n=1 Tax=Cellulosilyticum lentocellum (strain ATCC 49066 / DSM 5427 / NCIMB 11756 / RHM5) TaxID=642492 RepID=F2JJ21_CELLD|nr:SLC13 family permease [Cellulosilyticum lentocellum]ADZ83180.1 Citrate transporter [Cellulosilyticum lentocellum DSM 5427]
MKEHFGLMKIKTWIKKEIVLVVAVVLAVISCFWEAPKWSYIDFKVLLLLFNLMVVIAAFKEQLLLDYLAVNLLRHCQNSKQTGLVLIGITFVAAMFMTNDVALITFIPLTLIIGRKLKIVPIKWVVFQTLAANLGSSLTPMGNPQNLFIYTYYGVHLGEFLKVATGLVILSAIFLGCLLLKERKTDITIVLEPVQMKAPKQLMVFLILFIIILSSVVGVLDYRIAFCITIIVTLLVNRHLLFQVDYTLLLTFIGFFIFIGNLAAIPAIKATLQSFLKEEGYTYLSGLVMSQVISNVPATMLLAPFTENWQELVLGVDIGGMGTLIASLASVISYKLFVKEYQQEAKAYFKSFTWYNVLGLILLAPLGYGLLQLLHLLF